MVMQRLLCALSTFLLSGALAAQDFNADGHPDMAVGVPYESVSGVTQAGAVSVSLLYQGAQLLTQPASSLVTGPEYKALFGYSSAWGDFNADGYHDLAVGAPHASVKGLALAGAVTVFYGRKDGLAAVKHSVITQETEGVWDFAEPHDGFGWSLAVGDFNGNGVDDLAIGVPFEDFSRIDNAGVVHILYGVQGYGVSGLGSRIFHQNDPKLPDQAETWDFFGWTLEAGNFQGDAFDDLAVGIPHEDIDNVVDAGAVQIIPFWQQGVDYGKADLWTQEAISASHDHEYIDHFGWSLAAGDFYFATIGEPDGVDDLAIGVPNQDVDKAVAAGAVHILWGDPQRFELSANPLWYFHQNMNGAWGEVAEKNDGFGYSLAAVDRAGGTASLAIGVPWEDFDGKYDAGVVHVLGAKPSGNPFIPPSHISATISQDKLFEGKEPSETGDRFGYSLTGQGLPGIINPSLGTTRDEDLLVGVPYEDLDRRRVDVGQVNIVDVVYFNAYWLFQHEMDPGESSEANDRFAFSLPR